MNLPNRPVVGFTGTRAGMTPAQAGTVRRLLRELNPAEFHHGDCVGADEQAHGLAMEQRLRVIIHPPEMGRHRAWCLGAAAVLEVRPYMARNEDIVAACSVLIATPGQAGEVVRSGTWATVRRGRKAGRLLHVVAPDGTVGDGRPAPEPKCEKPEADLNDGRAWAEWSGDTLTGDGEAFADALRPYVGQQVNFTTPGGGGGAGVLEQIGKDGRLWWATLDYGYGYPLVKGVAVEVGKRITTPILGGCTAAEAIEAWASLARALPTPEEAARNLKANFRRLYRLNLERRGDGAGS
jgi:hypothetical protein